MSGTTSSKKYEEKCFQVLFGKLSKIIGFFRAPYKEGSSECLHCGQISYCLLQISAMTDSSSSRERNAPRTLNMQDTRLFEHWKQTFSSLRLNSANNKSAKSGPPFDLQSSAEPSLQKDPSANNA